MRVLVGIVAVLAPLLATAGLPPGTAEARGDAAWARRQTAFLAGEDPDPAPVREAVAAYDEALRAAPDDEDVLFKLMEATYFEGYFLTPGASERRRRFDRVLELSERSLELLAARAGVEGSLDAMPPERRADVLRGVPGAARAYFWNAVAWGLWGMSHSRVAAGMHGAAGAIRDAAGTVVLLDERYENAGGLRLLGRLHTATPRVVLFTGWIDRARGIELLRRACELSRADPRNPLFLAEALLDYRPEARAEALALLRDVAGRRPDPALAVEQSETIEAARRRLIEEQESSR